MKESSNFVFSKKEFGLRLTKLQEEQRYSNKFISLEAGLKNYPALKAGKVVPSVLSLYKLSIFFDVTIEFLVHGQEYNQRKQIPENSELVKKAKRISELSGEDKYIAMQLIDLLIYKQKYLQLVEHKL